LEIICLTIWVTCMSLVVFMQLKVLNILVATPQEQEMGFDEAKHSPGKAYDMGGNAGNGARGGGEEGGEIAAGAV